MVSVKSASLAAISLALCVSVASAADGGKPAYLDPTQPVDRRVDDLVGRLTLEEKASQLVNHTRAIPRLEVPEYNIWSEALHGVAANGLATVFPQAIALGATFDAPLLKRVATVTAIEGRAKHNIAARAGELGRLFRGLTFFSPNINIFRDPRWGRGQETYGEDPFLTGRMGVAFITGLQADDGHFLRAAATAKHFAVHSGPELLRHGFDAVVSKHDEEDTYLPAFRDAVVDGKVRIVMCVYNAVNGVPGCASDHLLKDTLRDAWKFQGFVTGDCDAVRDIYTGHKFAKSDAEAAAFAIKAGTDNDCTTTAFGPPGREPEYKKYIDAVQQGLLKESEVDVAVKRTFKTRFEVGLFDPKETVSFAQTPDTVLDAPEHRQLALVAARESLVLLKNDGVLPLLKPTKIAVVGPLADSTRVLLGNYNGTPSHAVTALDGIKQQFKDALVTFEPGTPFLRRRELIPTSALTTADGAPGLKAEVFASADFSGVPAEVRVDAQVAAGNAPDGPPGPPPTTPGGRTTRWTGFLTPDISGIHTLGVEGRSNRLYLDDKVVIDSTGPYPPGPSTAEVTLEKGHRYAIRVEAVPRAFASARLTWLRPMPDTRERALAAARDADVVIAVVGITSDLEGEEMTVNVPGFKGGDRTRIDLPQDEEDLLVALKSAGKPLVVVLMSGSALAVNWADKNANAILQAWYAGEEGGTAIAETLSGANNPGGRLPVTFYAGLEGLPDFTDYAMANRTYRYFSGKPLYPFGHGLSYSTFSYDGLALSSATLVAGSPLTATVQVKNTSTRDGDEVVQLYLSFPPAPGTPLRALRGFQRVHLRAGEAKAVAFALGERDLSYVDAGGTHLVGAGSYALSVGGGQPGTTAPTVAAQFTVTGRKELPR